MQSPNDIIAILNKYDTQPSISNTHEKKPTSIHKFLPDLFAAVTLLHKTKSSTNFLLATDTQFVLGILERLIVYFSNNSTEVIDHSPAKIQEHFLHRFFTLIEKNLDNTEYSVGALCKELAISKTQLCRKVKDLTGNSILENIRRLRLQKAATLLKSTSCSIADIAYASGFDDPNYFCRVFTSYFGYTPTHFRKEMNNGTILKISGPIVQKPDIRITDLAASIGNAIL